VENMDYNKFKKDQDREETTEPKLPEDLLIMQEMGMLDDIEPIDFEQFVSDFDRIANMTWIEKMKDTQEYIPELTDKLIEEIYEEIKDIEFLKLGFENVFNIINCKRGIEKKEKAKEEK
jgi:hypothetical protein